MTKVKRVGQTVVSDVAVVDTQTEGVGGVDVAAIATAVADT